MCEEGVASDVGGLEGPISRELPLGQNFDGTNSVKVCFPHLKVFGFRSCAAVSPFEGSDDDVEVLSITKPLMI